MTTASTTTSTVSRCRVHIINDIEYWTNIRKWFTVTSKLTVFGQNLILNRFLEFQKTKKSEATQKPLRRASQIRFFLMRKHKTRLRNRVSLIWIWFNIAQSHAIVNALVLTNDDDEKSNLKQKIAVNFRAILILLLNCHLNSILHYFIFVIAWARDMKFKHGIRQTKI